MLYFKVMPHICISYYHLVVPPTVTLYSPLSLFEITSISTVFTSHNYCVWLNNYIYILRLIITVVPTLLIRAPDYIQL